MQQDKRAAPGQDAEAPGAAVASLFDPAWIVQLQRSWIEGATGMMQLPLSGDVTQWIRAWGEVVGQVGLVNVNYAGSRDPQAERRITGRYSYGSQLGRLMEVLAPYVRKHQDEFGGEAGASAVSDFLQMAEEIRDLKHASVEDLLEKVRQWQESGDFEARLQQLREGLLRLEQGARRA